VTQPQSALNDRLIQFALNSPFLLPLGIAAGGRPP
jgi:hypothetical protein